MLKLYITTRQNKPQLCECLRQNKMNMALVMQKRQALYFILKSCEDTTPLSFDVLTAVDVVFLSYDAVQYQ
jgi:hypothetical protein